MMEKVMSALHCIVVGVAIGFWVGFFIGTKEIEMRLDDTGVSFVNTKYYRCEEFVKDDIKS